MTLFRKIAAAGISVAVLAGSLMPAQAMPLPAAPAAVAERSDVTQVQYRDRHDRWERRHWRRDAYRNGYRDGYYNGYRGYRDRRPHHRYYNGYWFPLAAFGAGAIIGGAIASQPRYVAPAPSYSGGLNPRHYEWCSARYRSYDSYSNTFQPYNGPRQPCYSPYY
ncbi:BA14K family protein [Neorhizobium petrolearium]|uniref:Lectin-like protein BA14k n=1 Tax=Neorhizobium petrolearium TaxID=515361 RepID=A0ABY8M3E7_9HYPH|nr:BA14K family protein [Neorhizobium petrolearium]MCC2608740.1 BA14K family protein [Neorhizobium petrolearium]WGI68999.1 BA14K family protein [Neorhizobium petrolearium]